MGSFEQPLSLGLFPSSFDVGACLESSLSATATTPSGSLSANFSVPAQPPVALSTKSVTVNKPVVGLTDTHAIWSSLFDSITASSQGDCWWQRATSLTPEALYSRDSVETFIRCARTLGQMPLSLHSTLLSPSLFVEFLLSLSLDLKCHHCDVFVTAINGLVYYGTKPGFMAQHARVMHVLESFYRDIPGVVANSTDASIATTLNALYIVLEWFWMCVQCSLGMPLDSVPYGTAPIVANEVIDDVIFDDQQEPSNTSCDYGDAWCLCKDMPPSWVAECVKCGSSYHLFCMDQRSQQAVPSLPGDGEHVFWSARYQGVLCPSCTRQKDPQRFAIKILDYGTVLRKMFAKKQRSAALRSSACKVECLQKARVPSQLSVPL